MFFTNYTNIYGNFTIGYENETVYMITMSNCVKDYRTPFSNKVCNELDEYFKGIRKVFTFKIEPVGTLFQMKVWKALQEIPYGKTTSYKKIGEMIGSQGYRAIGNAIHNNPIVIVIPCHRVINENGNIGGFALGIDFKQELLNLEKDNL